VTPEGRTHVFHQYTIDVGRERDAIVDELARNEIGVGVYYPIPVHRQPYVQELGIEADLPVTERTAGRTLSLPMFPGLAESDQDEVIRAVRSAVGDRAPNGAERSAVTAAVR